MGEDLGLMTGGRFHQYANSVGQVFYVDTIEGTTTYSIPIGFEDGPGDTWTRDPSKSWKQWNNNRTGRATLMDPNPPPPQTYLDVPSVQASLNPLLQAPESKQHLYRRPMISILRFLFPENEGYEVIMEVVTVRDERVDVDPCALQVASMSLPHSIPYDVMFVKCKRPTEVWGTVEDELHDTLAENGNASKNCYGMIQIGLQVQFYKYEQSIFSKIGTRMSLIDNVQDVMHWGRYLKQHPIAFV